MTLRGFIAACCAVFAAAIALTLLFPPISESAREPWAILTLDTADLRDQLVSHLDNAQTDIPDWYSVHLRTLCRGQWKDVTALGTVKIKDPNTISCEVPGALTSWIFRFGWVLIQNSRRMWDRSGPLWQQEPALSLFPYNDYLTHHIGVPASLLLGASLMALVNAVSFLDMALPRPRFHRFVHYQAVFFQFEAAILVTVAAYNIHQFVGDAQSYQKGSNDLKFDLGVTSGGLFRWVLDFAAVLFWVSAVLALAKVLSRRKDGQIMLPISDQESRPLLNGVNADDARVASRQ